MINPSYQNSCCSLIESLNNIIFTLDDSGKITTISSGCTEILGFLPAEMIGRSMSAFVLPQEKDGFSKMCGMLKEEKNHPFSFNVSDKYGGVHQAKAISRSISENQETGMIGLIGEISTSKQAEKIICLANTKLHYLNSIVRHDINNQLTVLHGYLSLMEQDDSPIKSPDIVRILQDATEKIHKLITFTAEYKDLGTHLPEWTNLYKAFQIAKSSFDAAGIQITPDPACQDLELFIDSMFIKVFHHLIDNSLIHGKTISKISLFYRLVDGGAVIVYEDNGKGIADAIRPKLFQPENGKKSGYGLFLVHEILAISGFTITETGTPEKGVCFEIFVPAGSFRLVKKE